MFLAITKGTLMFLVLGLRFDGETLPTFCKNAFLWRFRFEAPMFFRLCSSDHAPTVFVAKQTHNSFTPPVLFSKRTQDSVIVRKTDT